MAISLKHAFTSAKSDGPDSTLIQPSNWNDEHVLTMATARLLGRTTAGTGAAEEISVGTGLTLAGGSLSVTPNTYQPQDTELTALAALVSAADKLPYFTGSGSASLADFTAVARTLLAAATQAAQRTALGLGTADSPEFTAVNVGNASDTTVSRASAGTVAVEGNLVPSPASQAHGDVLYRGASGWERLAAGTSGQFLKTLGAGAAPAWGAVDAGSMTLLGTISTTSGSGAKSLTSLTLTGYKEIMLVWIGVSLTTSSADVQLSDGTSTYDIALDAGFGSWVFNGVTRINLENGALESYGYFNSSTDFAVANSNASAGTVGNKVVWGRTRYSTSSTSVTITTNGTWDAGSVNVYGVK